MVQTARRLTINFEGNSQIVTLSETDVSATRTFTSTFAINDTLVKRPPGFERHMSCFNVFDVEYGIYFT